jgi:diguanylate cyclase (GGDEF)-like protein
VVLPGTSRNDAHVVLSRIRRAVSDLRLPRLRSEARLSLSVGIAVYPEDGESFLSLLEAADARLFAAKQRGGDTVVSDMSPPARSLRAVR